jgi:hypothetical protein
MLHLQAALPMKESPIHFDIQDDHKVAQAALTWTVSIGNRKITGDRFLHPASRWLFMEDS